MVWFWRLERDLTLMTIVPDDAPPSIYGPDGEPRFFSDPAMDRLTAVLLNITSELWVQSERVQTLEALIMNKGIAIEADLAAIPLQDDEVRERQIHTFVNRVLGPLRENGPS